MTKEQGKEVLGQEGWKYKEGNVQREGRVGGGVP